MASRPRVRQPTHAGSWYTADAAALHRQLDDFLAAVPASTAAPRALIVPHAGFSYSGATAAHGYKAVLEQPGAMCVSAAS
jgi:MEMO1 family protein